MDSYLHSMPLALEVVPPFLRFGSLSLFKPLRSPPCHWHSQRSAALLAELQVSKLDDGTPASLPCRAKHRQSVLNRMDIGGWRSRCARERARCDPFLLAVLLQILPRPLCRFLPGLLRVLGAFGATESLYAVRVHGDDLLRPVEGQNSRSHKTWKMIAAPRSRRCWRS